MLPRRGVRDVFVCLCARRWISVACMSMVCVASTRSSLSKRERAREREIGVTARVPHVYPRTPSCTLLSTLQTHLISPHPPPSSPLITLLRHHHYHQECCAFVLDDDIWVAGGSHAGGWLDSCVIYHGASREWVKGPSLPCLRACAACALLF